jgi:hypothetical protein
LFSTHLDGAAVLLGLRASPPPRQYLESFRVVAALDDDKVDGQVVPGPGQEAGIDGVGVPAVDPAVSQFRVAFFGFAQRFAAGDAEARWRLSPLSPGHDQYCVSDY